MSQVQVKTESDSFSVPAPITGLVMEEIEVNNNLREIWDDEKIRKFKGGWQCLWCSRNFSGSDSGRAMTHVSKMRVFDINGIGFCKANIPDEHLISYQLLAQRKQQERDDKEERLNVRKHHLQNTNTSITETFFNKKQKTSVNGTIPNKISANSSHANQVSDLSNCSLSTKSK